MALGNVIVPAAARQDPARSRKYSISFILAPPGTSGVEQFVAGADTIGR